MGTRRWDHTRGRRLVASLVGALLVALAAAPPALGQGATIVGVVTDRSGEPLSGAQIVVRGTRQSALTDGRGQFTVRGLPSGTYTLDLRRIGFRSESRTVNLPAGGTVDVRFELSVSAVSLDEVVITGTGGGTERKKLGASVASLDIAMVDELSPVASFGAALAAKVPGVRSVGITGGVGSSSDLRVRGTSSFSLRQRPVVYVDGIRIDTKQSYFGGALDMGTACCFIDGGAGGDRLHDLNPEDIERVEIIKGPAAATLYGSEATNGVIQIFTKKGRASSAPRWTVSYGAGFQQLRKNIPTKLYPLFRGPDPDSTATSNGPELGQQALDANENLIKRGLYQSADLTVQGGGEALKYFVGGGFLFEQGSIQPNDMTRGNLRVNLNWTATDKWAFEVNSGYTRNVTTLLQSGNNWTALLGNAIVGVPTKATKKRPYGEPWTAVEDIQKLEANSAVDRWTGGVTVNFTPAQRFTHRMTVGLDATNEEISKFFPFGSEYVYVGNNAEKDLGYRAFKSVTFDYLGHLAFDLPAAIGSEFSFGMQGFREENRRNMAVGQDYAGPGVTLVSGGALTTGAEQFDETVNLGVFGQNRFSVADRFFLTAGFRLDGNSAFGQDYGFQFYPKADAAWVVSEHGFLPGFVSNLKLRGAIGMSGLTPGAFDQFRTFSATTVLDDQTGVIPDSPGNADLGPERTLGIEGGVEAGLFNDRIGVDFTYYRQKTSDALLSIPLPASLGFQTGQLKNVGVVLNRGWEVSVNASIIDGSTFRWSSTLTMDGNRNEILDLGEVGTTCGTSAADGKEYCKLGTNYTGHAVGAIFARLIVRDTALTAGPTASNLWGRTHVRSDTNVYVGDPFPHWNGSLGNTLEIGPVRLYALVSWEKGAWFSNADRPYTVRFRTGDEYLSRLDAGGKTTVASDSLFNYFSLVSAFDKRDNIRLRELSLSYELPTGLASVFGLGRTTLTLSGQNVQWWDDCNCRDPNAAFRGGADFGFVTDFLGQPQPRKFIATLRTTF